MIQHLIFTCPECGGHELRRVENARLHFTDRSIIHSKEGKYLPGETEPVEQEPRGLVGLRCAECSYPDSSKTTFRWKSWQDVEGNGCFSPDLNHGKEKVSCTIVTIDGRHYYRTYALVKPGETLTEEERRKVLRRVLGVQRGILVCERDKLVDVP